MKKCLVSLSIALALSVGVGGVAMAQSPTDAAKNQVCQGISGQVGGSCTTGGATLNRVLKAVLQVLSIVAGIVAIIMIVIGGLKYTTSGGDSNATSEAKRTLIYALVGLVIVAMAQAIVNFVLAKAK